MTYEMVRDEWLGATSFITARTSGSTGTPRPIRLSKGMVRESALRTISYFNLTSASHLHSCIAPDFIGGKMMLIRALCCGANFTFETPSNRPMTGLCRKVHLSMVSVVPSQMRYIIENINDLPTVDYYLVGGSALSPDLRCAIADAGVKAYESYGMTETASHIALRKIERCPTPFETLPGIKISLDNRGCLVIDMGEYGEIVTNDIATLGPAGQFEIKGRADHVIITGAKKVHPAEVEAKIAALFPDNDICVTSRPDPLWTNRIVLLVETDLPLDSDTLMMRMREILLPHELPKEILAVKRLERTDSGKIVRKRLE